ncbi:hypothetical protein R6Q57_021301 [Mikania cordata]
MDDKQRALNHTSSMGIAQSSKNGISKIGIGFTEVKPPFNHNYSIMPNINTYVVDLLFKSDRRFDFATGSSKPVPLITDPIEINPNISDDSKVCAHRLN